MRLPAKPRVVLGTAQLGSAYGRTNCVGYLTEAAALALLECAVARGIRDLDSARAYGLSEYRIGQFIRTHGAKDLVVRTKLDPLDALVPDASEQAVVEAVDRSVSSSLECLGLDRLAVVMVHRVTHLQAFHGAILQRLRQHQQDGTIGKIGASVNDPEQLNLAASAGIAVVQMPFNMLDRRWQGLPERLAPSMALDVRSIFLQGLLANSTTAEWPSVEGYEPGQLISRLGDLAEELNRSDVRDMAVAYVCAQPWVGGCVVGAETESQVKDTLELFDRPALTQEECSMVRARIPFVPADLVQPWRWPDRN